MLEVDCSNFTPCPRCGYQPISLVTSVIHSIEGCKIDGHSN